MLVAGISYIVCAMSLLYGDKWQIAAKQRSRPKNECRDGKKYMTNPHSPNLPEAEKEDNKCLITKKLCTSLKTIQ
jgi:hypothetical protein